MKGFNTLELNEATMIEAMQEYLNKRMGKYSPVVKGVIYKTEYNGGIFRVDVRESPKEYKDITELEDEKLSILFK